jgi:hypothetical protein
MKVRMKQSGGEDGGTAPFTGKRSITRFLNISKFSAKHVFDLHEKFSICKKSISSMTEI